MGSGRSTSQLEDRVCALLAVVIGASFCWIWAGPVILDPQSVGWLAHGDAAMHTVGWWYYLHTPWSWPPGLNPRLGLELSSSISLVDGLPLLAIPFKLLAPILPPQFQFWGIWFLLSFMLQGLFGYRLGRAVNLTPSIALIGALFCILYPPFLGRISGHMALGGHWLILAALWLYARPTPPPRWAWPVLLSASVAVHGYLFAMCGAVWAAAFVQRAWQKSISWQSAAIEAVAAIGAVLATLWLVGTLMVSSYAMPGFGVFRANLLSLFNSGGWSRLLPAIPGFGGEGEGNAYLGAGMLALFVLALFVGLPAYLRRAMTPRWLPLLVVVVVCALFSLSNIVAAGPWIVARIQLPAGFETLASTFRASGRFVWPAGYLCIFLVLVVLQRRLPALVMALAASLLMLQAVDTAGTWGRFRAGAGERATEWTTRFNDPVWTALAARYKQVRGMPVFELDPNWFDISYYGFRHGLAVSTVYLARVDQKRLGDLISTSDEALRTGNFESGTIYVLSRGAALQAAHHATPNDLFIEVDGVILFARGGADIAAATGHTQRYVPVFDVLPANTVTVPARSNGPGGIIGSRQTASYLLDGWSFPEDWGSWTERPRARMSFRSAEAAGGRLRLRARFLPTPGGRPQEVDVRVNGAPATHWSIDRDDQIDLEIPLPATIPDGIVLVDFAFAHPTSPYAIGESTDMRQLSMALYRFELVPPASP